MINRMTSILLSITLVFTPVVGAKDNGAVVRRDSTEFKKNLAEVIFESTRSIEQIIVLLRLAGASDEAVSKIQSEMTSKIVNSTALPKLKLENGQVLVDGKNSGIKLTSYSPLGLSYRGKNWRFNANSAPDKNFKDLLTFLGDSRKSAFFNMLVNDARAAGQTAHQIDSEVSLLTGGLGVLVAAAYVAFALTVGAPLLIGPVVGAAVGYVGGALYGWYKRPKVDRPKVGQEEKSIDDYILQSEITFVCDKKIVNFKIKNGSDFVELQIDRSSTPAKIEAFDSDKNPVPTSKITTDQRQKIATLVQGCKNADDAKYWHDKWLDERKLAFNNLIPAGSSQLTV